MKRSAKALDDNIKKIFGLSQTERRQQTYKYADAEHRHVNSFILTLERSSNINIKTPMRYVMEPTQYFSFERNIKMCNVMF